MEVFVVPGMPAQEFASGSLPAAILLKSLLEAEPVIPDDTAGGSGLRHAALRLGGGVGDLSPADASAASVACGHGSYGAVAHQRACELNLLRILPDRCRDCGTRLIIRGGPEGIGRQLPLVKPRFSYSSAKIAAVEIVRALFEDNAFIQIDQLNGARKKSFTIGGGVGIADLSAVVAITHLNIGPAVHVHAIDVITMIQFSNDGWLLLREVAAELTSERNVRGG